MATLISENNNQECLTRLPQTATCHIAATTHLSESLPSVLAALSADTIYFYTQNRNTYEAALNWQFEGKSFYPNLVEPVYPERWLFRLSRQIAERRVDELLAYVPDLLTLKKNPDINFKKLFIRKVSLGFCYVELSVLYALHAQIPFDAASPLIFISHLLTKDDLVELEDKPTDWTHVHFIPQPKVDQNENTSKDLPIQMLEKVFTALHFRQGLKILTSIRQSYTDNRNHLFYQTLRKCERGLRTVRNLPLRLFKHFIISWNILFFSIRQQLHQYLPMSGSNKTLRVSMASGSINQKKLDYYVRLYRPVLERLRTAGSTVDLMLISIEPKACKHFKKLLSASVPSFKTVSPLHMHTLKSGSEFTWLHGRIFKEHIKDIKKYSSQLFEDLPPLQRGVLETTLKYGNSLRYTVGLWYYAAHLSDFDILLGVEEDIECISILTMLRPILNKSFTSFIIPSCFPEYSECYDCVDVDNLSVALPFIGDIFSEQDLNARQIHSVGSQEWEEPYDQDVRFSGEIESLLENSSFVLGVLHQSIFVTMHQQLIYNNLTVDFLDIYERFLEQNPTACILIKPHPRDNMEQLASYLPNNSRIAILPKETHNRLLYQRIDAAVSIHSTMVMHALAHGIPVLSMYKYPDYNIFYNFIEANGGFATDDHDAALAWLHQMVEKECFRKQVQSKALVLKETWRKTPASEQVVKILFQLNQDRNASGIV